MKEERWRLVSPRVLHLEDPGAEPVGEEGEADTGDPVHQGHHLVQGQARGGEREDGRVRSWRGEVGWRSGLLRLGRKRGGLEG